MSESVSSAVPKKAAQRQENKVGKEAQLRGVIRVLIDRERKHHQPILAAKRLAKHCQLLKDEVERLKERSYNYETGLARAERMAAQYQQDLYRLTSSKGGKGLTDKSASNVVKGSPFYLPSSIQQLVDTLSSKNVTLMKILQKKSGGDLKAVELVQENDNLEKMVKALRQELDLKSSLLEHYESMLSDSKPKDDVDHLARSILEQRQECASLKSKLRSYENYVKHLREKNSSLMETIMTDLDKTNRQPVESGENDDVGAVAIGGKEGNKSASASASASRETSRCSSLNASRNASRRGSLKDTDVQTVCELQSTGIQTDSGVSCSSSARGSLDDAEIDLMQDDQEALKKLLHQKEFNEKALLKRVSEMEEACNAISLENENINATVVRVRQELLEEKKRIKELEESKEESEAILKLMQDRVDSVNQDHAEVDILQKKLQQFEVMESETSLMQQVIQNYEEDIKSYMVERNQLVKENKETKNKVEELEQQLRALTFRQKEQEQQQRLQQQQQQLQRQLQQQQLQKQQQQQRPLTQSRRGMDQQHQEPWQSTPWAGNQFQPRQQVVADGSPTFYLDSAPDRLTHQAQKDRRLREQNQRHTEGVDRMRSPGARDVEEDPDYQSYMDSGTVKCENCGEKFPTSLFQDHFRDCSRDT